MSCGSLIAPPSRCSASRTVLSSKPIASMLMNLVGRWGNMFKMILKKRLQKHTTHISRRELGAKAEDLVHVLCELLARRRFEPP
jgi:hypothetical protein